MATREEHEAGLAMFVTAARRDRFRDSLQNPRMREKLRRELAHFEHRLDPRVATLHDQSTKHDAHEVEVHRLLLNAGAPATCFVLTDERASDQGELPLRAAVEQLMWVGAGFLSCIPGRLGIYVSERNLSSRLRRRVGLFSVRPPRARRAGSRRAG